jgi:iron-sulfur cluster repair protein YtfE (RIC family)
MEATTYPTNVIRAGHRRVLSKLDEMERISQALGEPVTVLGELQALRSFFRRDIWALVWKEEDALFPELGRSAARDDGPIGQMRADHKRLRGANERFQSGVSGYLQAPGNAITIARLRESGQEIASLLRDHIARESRILEAATVRLDEAQNQRILELFERIDADLAWCFEQLDEFHP